MLADARKFKRKTDIFKAGSLHKQIEALKNHRYIAPFFTELCAVEASDIAAVNQNAALSRAFKHIYTPHESAFACAAHADYAVNIAVINSQADIF